MASSVPWGRLEGLTVTWAPARPASSTTKASAHATTSPNFRIICQLSSAVATALLHGVHEADVRLAEFRDLDL